MTRVHPLRALLATVASVTALLGVTTPAYAVTPAEKLQVLASFTQNSADSYNSWNAARQNQAAWAAYGFDWETNYCTASPDKPLGFDFTIACQRHDFGYGNYEAVGAFSANKSRLDDAFYGDLKRKCATYSAAVRPACNSLAWTYYEAVVVFGSTAAVDPADIESARALID
ncbi:phospholipase [Actinoplanes flavus]|uniref:Phospholipase n=1 Tax=Actinoplanes flavus TaxID=2820290 RepID=A0ABS3UAY6_9ACTN|nr:phospholipase [Actinoplanes flavus]MBO3735922.1 phospholipase [Actinoplanes flavus]